MEKTFTQTGDFEATHAAEKFLKESGFSLGTTCHGLPRGIMFGDYWITKYRNLDRGQRQALHGELVGDGRNGPVTIRLFDSAPEDAKAAFGKYVVALGV